MAKPIHSSQLFVALDSGGFVGAFFTRAEISALSTKYQMPVVVIPYFIEVKCPCTHVYVVPSHEGNIPAFVSNSEDKARAVQTALNAVSLSIPDDIKHWRQPVGVLSASAKYRWDLLTSTTKPSMLAEKKLFEAILRETQDATAMNIMDCCLEPDLVAPAPAVQVAAPAVQIAATPAAAVQVAATPAVAVAPCK